MDCPTTIYLYKNTFHHFVPPLTANALKATPACHASNFGLENSRPCLAAILDNVIASNSLLFERDNFVEFLDLPTHSVRTDIFFSVQKYAASIFGESGNMTKMYPFAALTCCLLAGLLCGGDFVKPRISGGTVLLFVAEPRRVVIVADSRLAEGSKPISDLGCKIISLSDDTAFFYSGGIAQIRFDHMRKLMIANEVARNAFGKVGMQPNSLKRLVDLANQWATLMKPISDAVLKVTPQSDHPNDVQLGGFAGLDSEGSPRMVLANMGVNVDNRTGQATASYKVYGWPIEPRHPTGLGGVLPFTAITEFFLGTTDRARIANAQFRKRMTTKPSIDHDLYRYVAAVEFGIEWNPNEPKVGGKVDGLVLDYGQKLRWIQRKQNCYEEDYSPATHR